MQSLRAFSSSLRLCVNPLYNPPADALKRKEKEGSRKAAKKKKRREEEILRSPLVPTEQTRYKANQRVDDSARTATRE
jgi:hypothetical protein